MHKNPQQALALIASLTGAQFDALAAHYAALRAAGVPHFRAMSEVNDKAWQAKG